MDKHTPATTHDIGTLVEDARALMAATAEVAGEQVNEARRRLAAGLASYKEMYGRAREAAGKGVRAVDHSAHDHPYQAMGVALGVGALIGYLVAHRCSRNGN